MTTSGPGFISAVSAALRHYWRCSGRAGRSEFWWFFLFSLVVLAVASTIDAYEFHAHWTIGEYGYVTDSGPFSILFRVLLLVPLVTVSARRLHDVGRSGWFLLIGLIPIVGSIVLLCVLLGDSRPDNRYGPSPVSVHAGPIDWTG